MTFPEHESGIRGNNQIVNRYVHRKFLNTSPNTHELLQESLADAKVSARQQCVYEDPIEEITHELL